MTQEQLRYYAAQGYTRVPVTYTLLADLETPLSIYLKLANSPYTYLFESVQGGEKWGRYSIIGLPCSQIIKVFGYRIERYVAGQCVEAITVTDPLAWIEEYQAQIKIPELAGLPYFAGGLVGYFAYDIVRYIEPHLARYQPTDELQTPDILLMLSEEVVVFDNLQNKLHLITHVDPQIATAWEQAQNRLLQLAKHLQTASISINSNSATNVKTVEESDFVSNQTYEQYEEAVAKIKQHIYQGDAMQVVYSRRLRIDYDADPLDLYRALRCLNPSPYLYHLNLADFYIIGSSPEILVRLQQDTVTVRPIAGTRPRGKNEQEDQALEQDLLSDEKELAEHLMLIDLGRNDVGRVAETASVQLTEKMAIERYSHVMHIVSNVVGRLKPGLTAMDVLRATFPAGTLSGAPKVRAMEIIYQLEPVKRSIYGGAVGYWAWNGNLDLAIAIRTAVIKDQQLVVQVGGGLVADSTPENEWDETRNKARAMLRAVAMVNKGLRLEEG